jgi:hypothetical protein
MDSNQRERERGHACFAAHFAQVAGTDSRRSAACCGLAAPPFIAPAFFLSLDCLVCLINPCSPIVQHSNKLYFPDRKASLLYRSVTPGILMKLIFSV